MSIIAFSGVSKSFLLQSDRPRSFQELIVARARRSDRTRQRMLWALEDVSFCVQRGETLGIIGHNGSGKSTCLKLLTRILDPTAGTVRVDGRVSGLLELGAGFHPELTGRENAFLYGSVLGLGRREIARRFDDIVAFAEIDRFIDVPIKFYSTGMQVRLAFATAINVSPDVLLVDEVLAVGDQSFQEKCLGEILAMKRRGLTIVFVSHNLGSVASLCDRAVWLDHGRLREDGVTNDVVQHYIESVHFQDSHLPPRTVAASGAGTEPQEVAQVRDSAPQVIARNCGHWGTHQAEIASVRVMDARGDEASILTPQDSITLAVRYVARERIRHAVCGVSVYREDGLHVTGLSSDSPGAALDDLDGRGQVTVRLGTLSLSPGIYYCSAALYSNDKSVTYDYHNLLCRFEIRAAPQAVHGAGVIHVAGEWSHTPDAAISEPQPQ